MISGKTARIMIALAVGGAVALMWMVASRLSEASGMDEVNYWRTANGLKPFREVPWMKAFAQTKAEYRAARLLKDGHDGPRCPAGCREGTAEATAEFGWLSCCMEETGKWAGAGLAIGADGDRYMVLIVHGLKGHAPIGRRVRPLRTAHLTPNPPIIPRFKVQKGLAIDRSKSTFGTW